MKCFATVIGFLTYIFRLKEKEAEERKRQRDAEAQNENVKRSKADAGHTGVNGAETNSLNSAGDSNMSDVKANGLKSSEANEIDRLEPLNDVIIPTSRLGNFL